LLYNGSVSVATDWFPDKKGMASGICVGFLGLAPVIWSLSGGVLIEKYGVRAALSIIGGIMVVISWIVSWFIERAPDGYVPEGWTPERLAAANGREASASRDYKPSEMVRTPLFYCVMAGLFLHVMTGLCMTGNAAAMAKVIVGMTDKQASLQVAILAVGSFLGRIIFGALSDRIGRFYAQVILMVITAADMLLFIGHAGTFGTFMAAVAICGAGYGGTVAIFPALVSDCFGQKNFSSNYAIVFLGFTLAGVVGPMITSLIYQHTGSYAGAFVFAGLTAIAGAGVALLSKHFYDRQ
ncbi:MAG: MFS transporter, partial [Eubacterium sp.]|nr:MFS transporter [Eubacterium sp.]